MRADLKALLDLQAKDTALNQAESRLATLDEETRQLDQHLQQVRDSLDIARRALADGQRRRDELEAKIESYRTLQERRRHRLDQVKNPKEASAVMAELDLARSVMAKEETEWVRSADAVVQLELKVQNEEQHLNALESSQSAERARVAERRAVLESERNAAREQRDATAAHVDKPLRIRYDRLRRTRNSDVVVPLMGGACGGCHTAVPLNRRSQIRSGAVLDGCEACGAILYPAESGGSV